MPLSYCRSMCQMFTAVPLNLARLPTLPGLMQRTGPGAHVAERQDSAVFSEVGEKSRCSLQGS